MTRSIEKPSTKDPIPPIRYSRYAAVKRLLDVLVSIVLLVILAPLFLLIGISIRLTSSGPVLFRHTRLGLHGGDFEILKFRTMYWGGELTPAERAEFSYTFKLRDDRRVTRVGRLLRRTSLDELPQLWNVLVGQMSLVGPRPVVPQELTEKYRGASGVLLSVRPGITGLWQVSGRSSLPYEVRVALDLDYVERSGPWLDLWILIRTPWAAIGGRGAL